MLGVQILLIIIILLIIYWELLLFSCNGAPFLSSSNKTAKQALELLEITPNDIVYDLGCGNCKMLINFAKAEPKATYIGVDQSPFARIAASISIVFNKSPNIKVINSDLLKINLREATKIYIWLSPLLMPKLLIKFREELKPGTVVVSRDFPFTGMEHTKIINNTGRLPFGKHLFQYKF